MWSCRVPKIDVITDSSRSDEVDFRVSPDIADCSRLVLQDIPVLVSLTKVNEIEACAWSMLSSCSPVFAL